jgi:hypothetical protein
VSELVALASVVVAAVTLAGETLAGEWKERRGNSSCHFARAGAGRVRGQGASARQSGIVRRIARGRHIVRRIPFM